MKSFICILLCAYTLAQDKYFPKDFWFGVTSGAYQVEGGWNADGKGISIWDKLLHDDPDFAFDHANGDVAADTYTHGIDDIEYLKNIGVTHYRFSISWSRILPDGLTTAKVNEAGVAYYNRLIDALIEANITPLVTLYHWDLPYYLQEMGGFLSEHIQIWFENYARICFERFGDRVKYWLTFNDPLSICRDGYEDGTKAPAIKHEGTGTYECAYNVLLSHARAFRLYDNAFRYRQNGQVSIAVNSTWYAPDDSESQKDIDAAYKNIVFSYNLWMTPIVQGDWPELIKQVVEENSREEGLLKSRLPEFTDEQKELLRGSLDFVALNFYTSYLCTTGDDWVNKTSSIYRDIQVDCWQPEGYEPGTGWLRFTPWGIRSMVNHVNLEYGNLSLIITENGYSGFADKGDLKDTFRVYYHRMYLTELLDAILEDGCNVFGYTATSFLDEFEWAEGYQTKFGMVQVDFNDDSRPRTRKYSSYIYENIIKTRKIDESYDPDFPPNQN